MGITPTDQHRLALLVGGPRVRGRYRHDWGLFADWCAAADHPPLPATPHTLAEFLHEHPAVAATQRRRVSAVNAVHVDNGHVPPGRSDIVRRRLDSARAERRDRIAALLQQRAVQLSSSGWPAGLFGRRDGVLLILVAAGMSFTQITRLRRGDVAVDGDGDTLVASVDGQQFRLTSHLDDGYAIAVAVYRRWAEVLAFLDRYPNTRLLAEHLADPHGRRVPELTDRQAAQPLLSPIDRWGHLPLPAQAMTSQSVAALTRAHLTDQPPVHMPLPLCSAPDHALDSGPPEPPPVQLDPGYYERGVQARRQAQEALSDVAGILDDVEDRADRILSELLAVLDGL